MNASKKMVAARTGLVLDQPFFGALALRLRLQEDPTCETAWVDGVTLGYNPTFIDEQSLAQTIGLVAHEVMHCALGHPWRRDGRDPGKWNEAADRATNPLLRDSNFTLPEGALYELDSTHAGKSAEWIYDRLPTSPNGDDGKGQGKGQGDGQGKNPLGEVRDAPPEAAKEGATEAEWKAATQQAANAARQRGQLSASLARLASEQAKPRVDWRSVLRRFVSEITAADYSWTMPNRRFLSGGLYLPALHSHQLGTIVVAVDTSGSVDDVLLAQFAAELRAVCDEAQPARVHVMYCDSRVKGQETYERGDLIELKPIGGGGTDFVPVFVELEKLEEPPACLIYLTDMCGRFPKTAPEVPVLWASTGIDEAPFGEVVVLQ